MTKFCVRIHHASYTFEQLVEVWRSAEREGYDGASLYDVLAPSALEVWTTLSALIPTTPRLVAIPLVLDVGYRHPALLAKMAASLDVLSGGQRLVLGLGYGGNRADHRAYGFAWPEPVADRVQRLEEQVDILRALWQTPRVTYQGRWHELTAAAGFPVATAGGPPILIASRGQRYGLPGVARHADLCNVSFDLGPDEWHAYQAVIARHAMAAGRQPDAIGLTHNATVVIGQTHAEAEARFAELAGSRKLTLEQARHGLQHALVGTPDEIVERLLAYGRAGVPLAWVFVLFPDLPSTCSLTLFAREVLPAYRAALVAG